MPYIWKKIYATSRFVTLPIITAEYVVFKTPEKYENYENVRPQSKLDFTDYDHGNMTGWNVKCYPEDNYKMTALFHSE